MLVAQDAGLRSVVEAGQTGLVVNLDHPLSVGHALQYAHRQRVELVGSAMGAAWALPERHSHRRYGQSASQSVGPKTSNRPVARLAAT